VKSRILVLSIGSVFLTSLIFFLSCKKINEATQLGDNLVPAVDNVHTFEVALSTTTNNALLNDTATAKVLYSDLVALGDVNDPEFGHTHANIDFNISPSAFGAYPFVKTDSLSIDSVVLSLSYQAAYGDTVNDGIQTLRVYEIAQNSGFNDTTAYKFADPATDFATTGPQLGSVTYAIKNLKDSITLTRGTDTSQVNNVVRIRLNNSLGDRFALYDTTSSANGGFKNDSIFRTLFRGFAVKADQTGNALSFFNLSDVSNTKLTVYFRYGKGDTSSFEFHHSANGQSNYIERQEGGNYLTYLNNGAGDKIYLQSTPGSYASIKIPGLSLLGNKIIHRAELLAVKIPSASDDIFTPPTLFLDKINDGGDTAFSFDTDMALQYGTFKLFDGLESSYSIPSFGGSLKSDNAYHFNITRYVQGIVTKKDPNYTLRLYAPLRTINYSKAIKGKILLPVNPAPAMGRVTLGGGSYTDSTSRLRLRIIYSNL
jgi:hypothetical protein